MHGGPIIGVDYGVQTSRRPMRGASARAGGKIALPRRLQAHRRHIFAALFGLPAFPLRRTRDDSCFRPVKGGFVGLPREGRGGNR